MKTPITALSVLLLLAVASPCQADAKLIDPDAKMITLPIALGETNPDYPSYRLSAKISAISATTNQPVQLEAWAQAGQSLTLDGKLGYSGTIRVALTNERNPRDQSSLVVPVVASAAPKTAAGAAPAVSEILQLGKWHSLPVTVSTIPGVTFPVTVSIGSDRANNTIDLPVTQPKIQFWANPDSVVGWGIGTTTVHAQVEDMHQPEDFGVAIETTSGSVNRNSVVLNANGFGTVHLRSGLSGQTGVTTNSPGFAGPTLEIEYRAPWLFLLAALAGGIAGSLAATFINSRARRHRKRLLVIAPLSALMATLIYAIAIPWLTSSTGRPGLAGGSESLVFVLTILVGSAAMVISTWRGWATIQEDPRVLQVTDAVRQRWEQRKALKPNTPRVTPTLTLSSNGAHPPAGHPRGRKLGNSRR